MKRSLYADLLKVFEERKDVLRSAGWVVAPPESPAWWDDLKSPHEVAIAAILVQLNSWEKVKETVEKLREEGLADLGELNSLSPERIDGLISRINFHRTKAERLKRLAELYSQRGDEILRDYHALRSIKGVGEETAKAIMLFAGNVLTVPPSEYLSRVLSRVTGIRMDKEEAASSVLQAFQDLYQVKLFYAGITTIGKLFCKPKPKCDKCIIAGFCNFYRETLRMGGESTADLSRGEGS
ncbi:MAG: endonuclease III domain-containing protein [Thermoprotei archaeon]